MIEYIYKAITQEVFYVENHQVIAWKGSILSLFQKLIQKQLSTYEGRVESTKKVLHMKSKVPIWIDKEHLFLMIQSHRFETSLYINYYAIREIQKWEKEKIILLFRHHGMILPKATLLQNQIAKAKMIESYLEEFIYQ